MSEVQSAGSPPITLGGSVTGVSVPFRPKCPAPSGHDIRKHSGCAGFYHRHWVFWAL